MHGCRSEGKFKIHELPQEQVRRELEDGKKFQSLSFVGQLQRQGKNSVKSKPKYANDRSKSY